MCEVGVGVHVCARACVRACVPEHLMCEPSPLRAPPHSSPPPPPSTPPPLPQVFYNNLLSLPFIAVLMLASGEVTGVWSEPDLHNPWFLLVAAMSGVIGFGIRWDWREGGKAGRGWHGARESLGLIPRHPPSHPQTHTHLPLPTHPSRAASPPFGSSPPPPPPSTHWWGR